MVGNRYNPYKGLSDRCVESLMPKGVEHRIAFGCKDWAEMMSNL